jgi:class 3 adenylate cyclase/tetratricopeptide (TPR) repeat protein
VAVCASCGHENSDRAKFCEDCGASLAAGPARREQRKTVTVLFCDVTGSTALGESTDPEALRALLARYFERMKGIVERHGGTVEKFIGDAVMAVFGIPQAHEDDALRAVRAALEMRDALPDLGIEARIGVNTGEVVTGTEERLATGDAVNVAARLEQAANPGEILIGPDTLRLVRHSARTEPVEPLELKGKAKPVPAHRLLSVAAEEERRHETRFVGRRSELDALHAAWRRADEEERCELVTVVGDPGVGKSRLTAEFLEEVEARVVRGRCLSYGEGITYWPVVEVVKQLDARPSDPVAAASVQSLLRESDATTSAEEIAWAFRKLLEEQAPLVCVFDDIPWGEETFLDLIEHVALLASAPILLVCLARPELVERRPQWPVAHRLAPLAAGDVEALMPQAMPAELRDRVTAAAAGNPLFVTEMVAMAREAGGEIEVPPTLKALLAARLDGLEESERSVLERGAVEGEIFHRGAVQALTVDGQVTPRLASLVRKELLRRDRSQLPGDDAFRFRHLLIRDAAYDALPKATRAELHERFAAWLEERAPDFVELDEVVGYHLEQAARYEQELGRSSRGLSERAGDRLASAGRRALWRDDVHAARSLFERALDLTRDLRFDVHLELALADTYFYVPAKRVDVTSRVLERAREAGDAAAVTLAEVEAAHARILVSGERAVEELAALVDAAVPTLEAARDHAALARAWFARAYGVANSYGRYGEMAHAAQESLRHARLAGQGSFRIAGLPSALRLGPDRADRALEALDRVAGPSNREPSVVLARATLLAMLGRFDEAWAIALPAAEHWRELGGEAENDDSLAEVALLAGDHAKAERYIRGMCEMMERRGSVGYLSTYAPKLGRSLCALGRHDEAEAYAERGRELGAEDDFFTQMLWRQVKALVLSHGGEHLEAERLAREAVEIAAHTDALNWQGDALCDLAEVLSTAGRLGEAADTLEQALERYQRKQNLAMAGQVRPTLEALRERARAAS